MNPLINFFFIILILSTNFCSFSQDYKDAKKLNESINLLQKQNSSVIKIHKISDSYGKQPINLLEIGTELEKKEKTKPAVFIMGNPEGACLIGSEAVISFAKLILKNKETSRFTWYLLPTLNPDALNHYFEKSKYENYRNNRPVNDDMDDNTDEDGPEDLNNDGYITKMRVKDPEGSYIIDPSEPRRMRKANYKKDEKGIYKIYTEGTDNDSDGKYNEDPYGGVNNGINFPHLFNSHKKTSGLWPGSEDEVFSVMKFIYEHPEIAATFTFGSSDFCISPPKGGRKGSANYDKIKVPKKMASRFGADPNRTYSMEEIIDLVQPAMPEGLELTPAMVAGFLGLGPSVNPLKEDLSFYEELSKQYKDFLKKHGVNINRLEPTPAKDGSFELWSYYHLGIPTFSMNFFTLPKPVKNNSNSAELSLEKISKMTSEDFIALGSEKISELLKKYNAPKKYEASKVIEMVKAGQISPIQISEMLKKMEDSSKNNKKDPKLEALLCYSKNQLSGKGFIDWKEFNHPQLGKVEIGGEVPYVSNNPPFKTIDSLISVRIPWVIELCKKLPELKILDQKTNKLGNDLFELTIWVENSKYLPFPTEMGQRNKRPAPAVLLLEGVGFEVISGNKRTPINTIKGNKTIKNRYIIRTKKGNSISVKLESKFAGKDSKKIKF